MPFNLAAEFIKQTEASLFNTSNQMYFLQTQSNNRRSIKIDQNVSQLINFQVFYAL